MCIGIRTEITASGLKPDPFKLVLSASATAPNWQTTECTRANKVTRAAVNMITTAWDRRKGKPLAPKELLNVKSAQPPKQLRKSQPPVICGGGRLEVFEYDIYCILKLGKL